MKSDFNLGKGIYAKMTTVVSIKKAVLNERGISNFEEWNQSENHVYIGRNMSFYVPGTYKSKWSNPFTVKKYGRDKVLELYEDYIRSNPGLYNSLEELRGKELGCWCKPESCHGDVLVKLLEEI